MEGEIFTAPHEHKRKGQKGNAYESFYSEGESAAQY